jgi:hypothetical protein
MNPAQVAEHLAELHKPCKVTCGECGDVFASQHDLCEHEPSCIDVDAHREACVALKKAEENFAAALFFCRVCEDGSAFISDDKRRSHEIKVHCNGNYDEWLTNIEQINTDQFDEDSIDISMFYCSTCQDKFFSASGCFCRANYGNI